MGGGMYAVLWASQVNLTRTLLTNNSATASGAGLHLFGVKTRLNVVNTNFTFNLAGLSGALPAAGATPTAAASLVPTRGGGIHVTGGSVAGLVASSWFESNGASLGAGMSFAPDVGELRVINRTRFNFNKAASQGGGLLVSGGTALRITNARFASNAAVAAEGAGGGLCCLQCKTPVLSGTRFKENAATYGGGAALLQPSGASLVTGCTFTNNTALAPPVQDNTTAAVGSMPGVQVLDGLYWPAGWRQQAPISRALLVRVPLAPNATSDSGAYTGGGGLYVSPTAAFNLSDSVFDNNTAVNGGGSCMISASNCWFALEPLAYSSALPAFT
jgi:hypothetical protein